MLSRLVKQDAEEATAEKATLAAIHAASTAPPRSRGRETHSEQGTSKNGADRAGAGKKSEAMRKERLEKGKGKAKQGKRASMGGYRNVFEEEDEAGQAEGWVDEETYVRELMAGERVEVPGIQVKVGGGGGQNAGKFCPGLSILWEHSMSPRDILIELLRYRRQHDASDGCHAWRRRTYALGEQCAVDYPPRV